MMLLDRTSYGAVSKGDPQVFEQSSLQLKRAPNPHVAFGFCSDRGLYPPKLSREKKGRKKTDAGWMGKKNSAAEARAPRRPAARRLRQVARKKWSQAPPEGSRAPLFDDYQVDLQVQAAPLFLGKGEIKPFPGLRCSLGQSKNGSLG